MTRLRQRPRASRRARLVCASSAAAIVWSLASAAQAQELPTNPVIFGTNGSSVPAADFTFGTNSLVIDQHDDRVVIDWDSFNIGALDTVTFNQLDANAIAFNRVDPTAFTTINGTLAANGGVWIFSPGGLLFGANAVVNVGSFLGSTARLRDDEVADALATNSVTLSALTVANGADLTVTAGADITATSGFVVLLGETIVQNGTVVSDLDAVWYGVAQGGEVSFTPGLPGAGPDLTFATVAGVAGQEPAFTQGSAGVTTAGTWVGISTPATTASGWSTLINIDGSVQATGVRPGSTLGVIILNGDGGSGVDLGNGVLDSTNATIAASADVYIAVQSATLGEVTGYFVDVTANTINAYAYIGASFGDVTLTGHNALELHAGSEITAGDDVYLTSTFGDVTVSGNVYGGLVEVQAYDLVTIDGLVDAQFIDIESTDGAVLIEATGYLHSSGSGSPGIVITAATDLTVEAGAEVLATDVIDLTSDGTMTLDGHFHGLQVLALSDGQMDVSGDLYGNAYVELETTTGDLLMHSGGSIDTSGFGGATPVTLTSGGSLTIEDGATVESYDDMAIRADGGDLTIGGDIYGDFVELDASGDLTVESTGNFVVNQFNGEAAGDILIDGVIDAPTTLFITSTGGDLTIGANADLSSFSIGLVADDQLTTVAGSHIDGDGGVGTLSFRAYGADGADSAMELSGDIDGQNVQLVTSVGSVTIHDGTITAGDEVNTYIAGDFITDAASVIDATGDVSVDAGDDIDLAGDLSGDDVSIIADGDFTQSGGTITVDDGGLYIYALNDITTDAGALINTSASGDHAIIYLNAGHDLYLAGDIDGSYFVTINSVGIGNDTLLEVSGSIYATDFIILYNDYGDIHLTGTAELYAGAPNYFSEPGVFIAAEGSILTDAGSYIHTKPGYVDGYVHIEVNDVVGSIDLSSDITSENITIEAPFGVVDIFLRAGTITTPNDFYIDANGEFGMGATLYADYVTIQAQGDLSMTGVIDAANGVSLISSGGDVYVDGAISGYAAAGTAIYISAEVNLTIADGSDIDASGDVVLQTTGNTGVLEVSGAVEGYNIYLAAEGGVLVGATGDIYAYDLLQISSDGPGATAADIQIDGALSGNGVSIINRNIGDVVFGATATVESYYYYCVSCRVELGEDNALLGADGDIYIYSAGSVITVAGSVIDATTGFGADQGLVTIVSNGADGANAAIDLSGDIISYNTNLQALAGSVRQRDGTISATESFNAFADQDFIQDGPGAIDALVGTNHADFDIVADGDILIGGTIDGYYIDITSHGTAGPGASIIQVAGTIYATDEIYIHNLNGGITVTGTGVLSAGTPYEASNPYIHLDASQTVTTQAGSQIYTDPGYAAAEVVIESNALSGLGVDLNGDISSGTVTVTSYNDSDIEIGGDITAQRDIRIDAGGALTTIAGSLLDGADQVVLESDRDMTLGGDIEGLYVAASIYDGETGSVDGSVLRVDGTISAVNTIRLTNLVGDVEIGSTAALYGNLSGDPYGGLGYGYQSYTIEITGENIVTEAGSLITVGAVGGPRLGSVYLHAVEYYGAATLVDLSGDIDTETILFEIENGSLRMRDGNLNAINDIFVDVDGYFIVDDPAEIYTQGDFTALSHGGMTVEGDITGQRIILVDYSANDLVIGGGLYAEQDITIHSIVDDVRLTAAATLLADTDNVTGIQDYNGVHIAADGQVTSAPGSVIRVGASGAPTGDVTIMAQGLDAGGFSSIDLASDIKAQHLYLTTYNGGIRLRDGDIVLTEDLYIYSPRGFLMDAPATITADGFVDIRANYQVSVIGTVDSGEYIRLASIGATGGGVSVNGYLYADGAIFISSADAGADIVLGGPTIISDADDTGVDGLIIIDSAGAVVAPGGGLIQVGDNVGGATGDVTIHAEGGDGASTSAIDLNIDIRAATLTLDADAGSIHLGPGADFYLADDFTVDSVLDFAMDEGATVTGDGDIDITAHRALIMNGALDSAGDVYLLVTGAGSGDLSIGGSILADGSVDLHAHAGDVLLYDAAIVADADGAGSGATLQITADGQVIAEGGSLAVGVVGVGATGGISITAFGSDSGTHAALDLDLDSYSTTLDLFSYDSIHLAGGALFATQGMEMTALGSFSTLQGADIQAGGDVVIEAGVSIDLAGDIVAGGDIDIGTYLFTGRQDGFMVGPGDVVVSGAMTANGSVYITAGYYGGDIYLDGTAVVTADADNTGIGDEVYIMAAGQVVSQAGSSIQVGPAGTPTGDVTLLAQGADNANYSALDLNSDIEAQTLTLDADAGSIHLAGGAIHVTEDLTINSAFDFLMDEPANISADADVTITAARSMLVYGGIDAGGDINLLLSGPNAQELVVDRGLNAGGDIYIRNGGSGLLTIGEDAALKAGEDVFLQASGGLTMDGGVDAAGYVYIQTDSYLDVGGSILAGGDVELISGQDMVLSGDIDAGGGVDALAGAELVVSGQINAGNDVNLRAYSGMIVDGDVNAGVDIRLYLYGGESGGDIAIGGELIAQDDITVFNYAGSVLIGSTALLNADVDANGGDNADILIYAENRVVTDAGSLLHVGDVDTRTGFISIHAYGEDLISPFEAAIDLSGDMDAESISLIAHGGSVFVRAGTIGADEDIEIVAADDFLLGSNAVIWGAQEREFQGDISTESTLPGLSPGVFIQASDVDIDGQIISGDAEDDATIVIQAMNPGGQVTVGGADLGLGTGFTLSNAEFQNLEADRIVILAGPAEPIGTGYDLHLLDLTLDAGNTSQVWLGTNQTIFVEGTVSPTVAGAVDLHLGFAVLGEDVGSLLPFETLYSFIPDEILIMGGLGGSNPFGSVTLIAQGDILMGSAAFIAAAAADPEFDAAAESDNYASPGEDHVFIAADILQMASMGRILQQDTHTGPGYGGLVLGLPQEGLELIFSPDSIQGETIGGPTGWIADFNAGPTRIELFGSFNGSPQAVTGSQAALVEHLLDPDILLAEFFINSCQFGSTLECSSGDSTPPFQNPTPPVHSEPSLEPAFDDPSNFFATFPFAEPDEEEDEDPVEGEPVTGSGNEDLWPIRPGEGARP